MRKWNYEKRIQNTEYRTQHVWAVIVVLVVLAFARHSNGAEPNPATLEPNYAATSEPNLPEFNNGLTLSGLFQDGTIDDAPDGWGRIGYQYGSLEPFIGLAFDAESFEIGFKLFSRNAVTDVKYFSDLLATYFNSETMEIRGYSGAHRVIAKEKEDTYTGAILGIEQKEIGSPLSLTAETQFNDDNRIFYYVGLKWGF